ncbi:hypothetical protein lerEdw1_001321 [Lerista edwardsae]|nr:hypothetical protein lerEdw1_001321 [Lerista edwardsae]
MALKHAHEQEIPGCKERCKELVNSYLHDDNFNTLESFSGDNFIYPGIPEMQKGSHGASRNKHVNCTDFPDVFHKTIVQPADQTSFIDIDNDDVLGLHGVELTKEEVMQLIQKDAKEVRREGDDVGEVRKIVRIVQLG